MVREVRFEDLEAEPIRAYSTMCESIGLGFNDKAQSGIASFLEGVKGYKKNAFELDEAREKLIRSRCAVIMEWGGYN